MTAPEQHRCEPWSHRAQRLLPQAAAVLAEDLHVGVVCCIGMLRDCSSSLLQELQKISAVIRLGCVLQAQFLLARVGR